jgi:hypothetical protein
MTATLLTGKDVSADSPVEKHELAVDRESRTKPSVGDALF